MVTRVRIEAEGSSTAEVEQILTTAHEVLVNGASRTQRATMFGLAYADADREYHPGLADAQAGEFVIERFARQASPDWSEPGDGAIVYRGRMVCHFAAPSPTRELTKRFDAPGIVVQVTEGAGEVDLRRGAGKGERRPPRSL